MTSWINFENSVRQYSEYIWNRNAIPDRIEGVNFDCVLKLEKNELVLIEITEKKSLSKIRDDIAKIQSVMMTLMAKNIMPRTFIVCNFQPTQGMRDSGKAKYIEVLSFDEFQKKFFNFETYKNRRLEEQFGSVIDPITGENDNISNYIPVKYRIQNNDIELTIDEIAERILAGQKIIMIGDYGTGKSRCVLELFKNLAGKTNKSYIFPIAINLKDTWGLESSFEVIRRHFSNLGMDENCTNNVIKAYNGKSLCFLLDGFDEIGAKPWSEEKKSMPLLRKIALQAAKDIIVNSKNGLIITGREHYFNNNDEMYTALGLDQDNSLLITCKEEFDIEEFNNFIKENRIESPFPSWIPRKPLLLKTFVSIGAIELEEMLQSNDISIWFKFLKHMCDRDSRIHTILDGSTIRKVLQVLANKTRVKPQNVGPVSEQEIVDAFREVTHSYPNEMATTMLQRLPGLGRVSSDTGDRNFVDNFILDGLRALDLYDKVISKNKSEFLTNWIHPLKKIGIEVLSFKIESDKSSSVFIDLVCNSIKRGVLNTVLVSDIFSALANIEDLVLDYKCKCIEEPHFGILDLSYNNFSNVYFEDGIFEELHLGKIQPNNIKIHNCAISKLYGVPSQKGIPKWITNTTVDQYELVDTLNAIKKSGLTTTQSVLVSILIKVYRQAGNGRLEHTLTKGLSNVNKRTLNKLLNLLKSKKVLLTSKDTKKNLIIYKPNNKYRNRIENILSDLERSKDPIWLDISKIS